MKLKVFNDSSSLVVEKQVNEWLAKHPGVSVVAMTQSEALDGLNHAASLTISILYRE
jgi:hypothetical protein